MCDDDDDDGQKRPLSLQRTHLAHINAMRTLLLSLLLPSPTGKFATMGPYAGNKVFEMACLFWFNKKDQISDKKINSRKVKVVTRGGVVTKERKGTHTFSPPPPVWHKLSLPRSQISAWVI